MKKYYLQNMNGNVEEAWFNNDNEVFECVVKRNKAFYENCLDTKIKRSECGVFS